MQRALALTAAMPGDRVLQRHAAASCSQRCGYLLASLSEVYSDSGPQLQLAAYANHAAACYRGHLSYPRYSI